MYHFPNQQLYNHNPYQQCPINIQDSKLQNFSATPQAHYPQVLPQINLEPNTLIIESVSIEPETKTVTEATENVHKKKTKAQTVKVDTSKKAMKLAVDTSTFSIEERLVAAVWLHERKYTSSTVSEIKYNFKRRFGRDPPSKTTLFAWERKLFASGNVCDAPRTGRPVNRRRHMPEVAASLRAAPTLSLRARARALRLPRSTLHHILRHDLPPAPATPLLTDKPLGRRAKTPRARAPRAAPASAPRAAPASAPRAPPPAPHYAAPPPAPAHTHTHGHAAYRC